MSSERRQWHFGVLSITGTGHLNPLIALSQVLRQRGHRVTLFAKPKAEQQVRHAGLEFVSIGNHAQSLRKTPERSSAGIASQLRTLRFNLQKANHDLGLYLSEAPLALRQAGVDALLVDEIVLTGRTIAQALRLPWFIISTSIPHNFGWKAHPWLAGYRSSDSMVATLERVLLENSVLRMRGPIRHALDRWRRQNGLGPVRSDKSFPALAQITPMPACLDLPRRSLPRNFCYTAPFIQPAARLSVPFPWERLSGQPLIYVTLGTTSRVQPHIFRIIAEGCAGLGVQLVISLGNRLEPHQLLELPGNPLVVRFAPQIELLKCAHAVIAHAGLNTALEALLQGKPFVAIPLAYDQPAVARCLEQLGVAEVLPAARLSAQRVRAAVAAVLSQSRYREAAARVQNALGNLHGPEQAVEIIEEKLAAHVGPGAWLRTLREVERP